MSEFDAAAMREVACKANPELKDNDRRFDQLVTAIKEAAEAGEVSLLWERRWGDWGEAPAWPTPFWPSSAELARLQLLGFGVDTVHQHYHDSGNGFKSITVEW